MAIRAKSNCIFHRILPSLGHPLNMVGFKLGFTLGVCKGGRAVSEHANAVCASFGQFGTIYNPNFIFLASFTKGA